MHACTDVRPVLLPISLLMQAAGSDWVHIASINRDAFDGISSIRPKMMESRNELSLDTRGFSISFLECSNDDIDDREETAV
jgi:hypothetical protein